MPVTFSCTLLVFTWGLIHLGCNILVEEWGTGLIIWGSSNLHQLSTDPCPFPAHFSPLHLLALLLESLQDNLWQQVPSLLLPPLWLLLGLLPSGYPMARGDGSGPLRNLLVSLLFLLVFHYHHFNGNARRTLNVYLVAKGMTSYTNSLLNSTFCTPNLREIKIPFTVVLCVF